jgi:hypothetical protein
MGVAVGDSPGAKIDDTHGWAPGWEFWGKKEPGGFGKFRRAWLQGQDIRPGVLRDDATTYTGWRAPHDDLYFKVNAQQAYVASVAMASRQEQSGQISSYYNLYTRNCAEFVEDVLHAADIPGVPDHAVFWPRELYPILAAETNGN